MSEPGGTTARKNTIVIGMITVVIASRTLRSRCSTSVDWLIGMVFGSAGILVKRRQIRASALDPKRSLLAFLRRTRGGKTHSSSVVASGGRRAAAGDVASPSPTTCHQRLSIKGVDDRSLP